MVIYEEKPTSPSEICSVKVLLMLDQEVHLAMQLSKRKYLKTFMCVAELVVEVYIEIDTRICIYFVFKDKIIL